MPPTKENAGNSAAVSALMALAGSPPATPKAEDHNMDEVDLRGKSVDDNMKSIANKSNTNNETHPKTQALNTTHIPIIDETMAEHLPALAGAQTLDSHDKKSANETVLTSSTHKLPTSGGKKASPDEASSTSNITRFPNKVRPVHNHVTTK